ncbi:MAG: alpha/beta hydrolase [Actinobacteria bacterium]|nr:alpha/beta hydrolase [Actinomycetota bacterium]
MRKSLDEICAGSRCKNVLRSPQNSLARLVQRLTREPVTGLLDQSGDRPEQIKIGPAEIYELLFAADFNLYIYEQLPAAIDATLRGDSAPLVRLFAVLTGESGESVKSVHSKRVRARRWHSAERRRTRREKRRAAAKRDSRPAARAISDFSNTLNLATSCEDFNAPWARGAALGDRQPAIDAAAAATPDDAFMPFSRDTVKDNSLAALCRGWQESADVPSLPAGPLPDVPVLALDGTLDVRTPLAWAEQALAGAPRGQVVPIPHTGHSTIGTDISGCALSLAKRFLIYGGTDGACKHGPEPVPVASRAFTSTRSIDPVRGSCKRLRGRRCRTARQVVTAGYLAMRDAVDQLAIGGMIEGPGLYGGRWELSDEFDEEMIDEELDEWPLFVSMQGMQQVPGVLVDGRIDVTDYPRVTGNFSIVNFSGRSFDVTISGKLAYDSHDDRIRLAARSGKARVSLSRGIKRSAWSGAAQSGDLKARLAYARATGTRRIIR